jgi:hypothetical protein
MSLPSVVPAVYCNFLSTTISIASYSIYTLWIVHFMFTFNLSVVRTIISCILRAVLILVVISLLYSCRWVFHSFLFFSCGILMTSTFLTRSRYQCMDSLPKILLCCWYLTMLPLHSFAVFRSHLTRSGVVTRFHLPHVMIVYLVMLSFPGSIYWLICSLLCRTSISFVASAVVFIMASPALLCFFADTSFC